MKFLTISLIILSFAIVFLGALFKIQHWIGADILMMSGLLAEMFAIIMLVVYLRKKRTV